MWLDFLISAKPISHYLSCASWNLTWLSLFIVCYPWGDLTLNLHAVCLLWKVAILLKSMRLLPVNWLENTICYFYELFFLSLFAVICLLCRIISGKFRFMPELDHLSGLYGSSRCSWSREIWQIMWHVVSVCHYVYPVSQSAWCILITFPCSSCNDAWLASPNRFCS